MKDFSYFWKKNLNTFIDSFSRKRNADISAKDNAMETKFINQICKPNDVSPIINKHVNQ